MADREAELEDCLGWIVAFMDEHPEWTEANFTEEGNAGSETEWLAHARELVYSKGE